jgi:hypothetical protein
MAREETPSISLAWHTAIRLLALHPFCAHLSKRVGSYQPSPNAHSPAIAWQSYLSSTRSGIKIHCVMSTSMPGLIPLTVPRYLRTVRSPDRSSRAHQSHCGIQKAHETCTRATLHPGVPHLHPMSAKGSLKVSPTGSAPSSTAYPASSKRPGTWRTSLHHVRRHCTTFSIRTRPTCPLTNSDARSTPRSPYRCSAASSGACRRSNQSAPASSQASAPTRESAASLHHSRHPPPPHPHAPRHRGRWYRSTTASQVRVRLRAEVTVSTDRHACPPSSASSYAMPSVRADNRAPRPQDLVVAGASSPHRAVGVIARERTRC